MSSATSIDRAASAEVRLRPERGAKRPSAEERVRPKRGAKPPSAENDGLRPWHFFLLVSLLAATVAVIMARQPAPEHLVLLSLTIGAAGLCGAALYATLAPLVKKNAEAGRASLSDRARAALDREKMLVLRSIKELEFDRAMGKMSPADFDELAGRLRARAISLMKQLDAAAPVYRAAIEQELAARLDQVMPSAPTCPCGTTNDVDAAFCKRCGARLRPERGGTPPSESERQP